MMNVEKYVIMFAKYKRLAQASARKNAIRHKLHKNQLQQK